MRQVLLYDTTLRDGMQGQGMSLSAQEKVRVVAALDELGIHFIEAGLPRLEPEGARALRAARRDRARAGGGLRLRHDPAARHRGRRGRGARGCSPTGFAPVVTLVGKTWGLHLEKVTKVSREENLAMIGDSVAYLARRRQARDLRRRALLRRLPRRPGLRAASACAAAAEAGAENVTLCDTNGSSLPAAGRGGDRPRSSSWRSSVAVGIHTHNDAGVRGRELAGGRRGRAPAWCRAR